jgi:hypothetical protein
MASLHTVLGGSGERGSEVEGKWPLDFQPITV